MSKLVCHVCSRCRQAKPRSEFGKHAQAKSGICQCIKCRREAARQSLERLKIKTFAQYGGACVCCGISDIDVLTIDHIDQQGAAHKRALKLASGGNTYRWLRDNGYPEGFRLLCFNCNVKAYRQFLRTSNG
jgi:hypothetical protein